MTICIVNTHIKLYALKHPLLDFYMLLVIHTMHDIIVTAKRDDSAIAHLVFHGNVPEEVGH